ncbi:MAG: recombination mediator RecR, partial [Planctomycetota bacterium]
PGIGPRSAERIVFHLLKQNPEDALALADAIRDVKTSIKHCPVTFNLTEGELCPIYADDRRDRQTVLVVEQPKDVIAIEDAGAFGGTYHVLLGRIAPLEGVEPEDLTIDALLDRIAKDDVREIIMGTNPNLDGDATAMFIQNRLETKHPDVKVTRLARGLPTGGSIEYANRNILGDALRGRQSID